MDIFARIRLGISGGDQAANEVKKVKKAFDDVRTSSQGISAGVGGGGGVSDPFTRATGHMPGPSRDPNRPAMPQVPSAPENNTPRRNPNRPSRGGMYGQGAYEGLGVAGQAVSNLESGNMIGSAGSMLSGGAKMLGRFALPAAAAGMLLKLASSIGTGQEQEVRGLMGSGMGGLLGYKQGSSFAKVGKDYASMGASRARKLEYRMALFSSGGYGSANDFGFKDAPVSAASWGRFTGLRQQTGDTKSSTWDIAKKIGLGLNFYTQIADDLSGAIQEGMAQGFTKGGKGFSDMLSITGDRTHRLMKGGGVTYAGAMGIGSKIRQSGYRSADLSRPEDVHKLISQYDKSKDFVGNLADMTTEGSNQKQIKNIIEASGGNRDRAVLRLRSALGLNVNEAIALYNANTARITEPKPRVRKSTGGRPDKFAPEGGELTVKQQEDINVEKDVVGSGVSSKGSAVKKWMRDTVVDWAEDRLKKADESSERSKKHTDALQEKTRIIQSKFIPDKRNGGN